MLQFNGIRCVIINKEHDNGYLPCVLSLNLNNMHLITDGARGLDGKILGSRSEHSNVHTS